MLINALDGSDGIAANLNIVHVANAIVRQSISFLQESIQRFRPVLDRLAANYEWIHRIAKHAAKDRYETRYRSHRIERRPVRLDEERIGINGKQGWQGKHVRRRFQDPAARTLPDLQMLKETTVIFVCGQQILAKEPGSIRRDIIHRIKLITHEGGRHQADTFLRQLRTNGVHVAERGRQPIEAVTTLRCALNSSFLIVASRRGWRHDFPSERRSMLGVRSEQRMQERGTAAGQADDKERFVNFLPYNACIKLPVPVHEQTGTQCAYEIGPKSDLPDQAKAGLAVAGVEQSRETLEKVSSAKIIEVATALRRLD